MASDLYQHHHIQRQETELDWHSEDDLFSEDSRKLWGVSRGYLTTAGFGAGALSGAGIDALTLGTSLGAGALVGGLIGAAGSYFYGDKLQFPALRLGALGGGLKTASFGPVQDSQFGYVTLGRAVNHWFQVSNRNHAGRDLLNLAAIDSHWLEQLDRRSRQSIQRAFDRCRKQQAIDDAEEQNLVAAITAGMNIYSNWRLNQP